MTRASGRFLEQTRPWQSTAGGGPVLRGRRADGDGPTIHFLSGNGFCGGVYWQFLEHFRPHHALFLHDIEGHGASDAPERFSGVGALCRRIPQVIAEQGLKGPLIGMGHSFGAALTLKVAADNPGLFKALVLLDPIVFPTPVWIGLKALSRFGLHPMTRAARRRRQAWPSRDDALAHLRGRGIYKGWTEEALECFVDHAMEARDGRWVLRCPPELEGEIYEHPVYPWPSFRKARLPILFLHGAGSYDFFPMASKLAHAANPGVHVRTTPGHHCFMLEHPSQTHAAVAGFLAEVHA